MPVSVYSTGTIAIAANATSVVGTGSNWSGQNAMSGDLLVVAGNTVIIGDVTDPTHLAIDAWPYAAVTAGTAYKLYKVSPLRFAGGQAMVQVDQLVTALDTSGFYFFVKPTDTVPDPSYGNDNQYAFQATTGKLWQKTGGTWNFIGVFKGFGVPAPWNSATAYLPFDVSTLNGTSYVCILANTNQTPPNATYWTVLAGVGATGPAFLKPIAAWVTATAYVTGPPASYVSINGSSYECLTAHTSGTFATDLAAGKWGLVAQAGIGYGGSSTTSLAIGTGSKAFTTAAGLAYLVGNYVRAASAAGGANFMEGAVTTYSGTTLTINITKTGGSGTHTDWNFSVSGAPGTGDMLSTNFASEYVGHESDVRANLGAAAEATTISGGGLVTGGGDLSANRTVTVTAASKSDQQTGTSAVLAVTPAHQQDHPSAAKAWAYVAAGSLVTGDNIASVVRNSTGNYTVNFTTAFSSTTSFGVCLSLEGVVSGIQIAESPSARTTSSVLIDMRNTFSPFANVDNGFMLVAYGAQ